MPSESASFEAPRTSKPAPSTSAARPPMKSKRFMGPGLYWQHPPPAWPSTAWGDKRRFRNVPEPNFIANDIDGNDARPRRALQDLINGP